jgi:dTDP-4-dehydrorhamnose reductase
MKILIFGKNGQLGKAFREVLDQTGASRLHHIEYLGRSQCDLLDGAAITRHLDHFNPDLMINASAYTAVDKAETDRDVAFDINAKAPAIPPIAKDAAPAPVTIEENKEGNAIFNCAITGTNPVKEPPMATIYPAVSNRRWI